MKQIKKISNLLIVIVSMVLISSCSMNDMESIDWEDMYPIQINANVQVYSQNEKPIEGMEVIIYFSETKRAKAYTDIKGSANLTQIVEYDEFEYLVLLITDVDGEENGLFEPYTKTIVINYDDAIANDQARVKVLKMSTEVYVDFTKTKPVK